MLIFNDQDYQKLNAIWIFQNIKQIINKTNGFIKYSDIYRKKRLYKTCKSFFRIIKIETKDKNKYFKL